MKILLLHQYFLEADDFGGSRFNEIVKNWSPQAKTTVIAGMIHANGSEKRKEYKGRWFVRKKQGDAEVIRCHVAESYNNGILGRLWGYVSFMVSSLYAGVRLAKGNFDVVLVTSPPLFVGISGVLISKFKGIPLVFEVRDLWPESAIDTGVLTNKFLIKFSLWAEKWIYKNATKINVLTPAFKEKLIEDKGIQPEKIFYIPNACDFSLADKVLESFDRDKFRLEQGWQDKFVITYVGAHGIANHLDQIIEAAAQLDDRVQINLIGDGMQKKKLIQLRDNLRCNNVVFFDPVPKNEVFKYIATSDVGTSILKKVDTFKTIYSNKTFDYMSCKRPVLLLIDGVSRQLVEDAKCGFYAEPENVEAIRDKILELQSMDSSKLDELGKNGYEYAKLHFDREKLAKTYLLELDKIKS